MFFEYGLQSCFYDNRKAVEELGVEFRPLDDTIRDAIAFYKDRGML